MIFWAQKHACCTCEYWNGPRQIQSDPRTVECEPHAKGICEGPSKFNRGKMVVASTCVGSWRNCYELMHGMRT